MSTTHSDEHARAVESIDGAGVVKRAADGARLLTARGFVMRVISVVSNLALIGLVSPKQFGLFAVVRGTLGVVHNAMELGFEQAMVRRSRTPEPADYAAVLGVQFTVLAALLLAAVFQPHVLFRYSPVEPRWYGWLAAVIATMAVIPIGTGARVRIERALQYHRLAVVDVTNVVVQNIGLLVFALIGRFEVGVFAVVIAMFVTTNTMLAFWSPGRLPSWNFRRIAPIVRDAAGFTATAWTQVAREFVTPLVVGALFGLEAAGLWAFMLRVGQLLDVTFAGFQQAAVPAAARLRGDPASLRQLATNTLVSASTLSFPISAAMFVSLPVVAVVTPKWAPAIHMAQLYVLCYSVSGVTTATLYGIAIALRGGVAALVSPLTATVVTWAGLALVAHVSGGVSGGAMVWIVAPMLLLPALLLIPLTARDVRPHLRNRALADAARGPAACYAVYAVCVTCGAPPIVSAILAGVTLVLGLRPAALFARLRGSPRIRAHVRATDNA